MRYIVIIFIAFLFGNCARNGQSTVSKSFKPSLDQAIIMLMDSLKDEMSENKLLSIEFYFSNRHSRGCEMRIFISDCYASAYIDAYTNIHNSTIAIYNLKDDVFELVNKNEIIFFTDTVKGFKDTCVMFVPEKEFFYKIHENGSIDRISRLLNFPQYMPLRKPKCPEGITYTPPEEYWHYYDSLQAEEKLEYYKKEVKYYRSINNKKK